MEALKKRIREEAKNQGSGILNVAGFVNHRIDAPLIFECACRFASIFRSANSGPTVVLTAETSGIGPGLLTASLLSVDLLFARKKIPITMTGQIYKTSAPLHTKESEVMLAVSGDQLGTADRVLIIDDFLATGKTIAALVRIVKQAEAELLGIGALIEKSFEGGRKLLRTKVSTNTPIVSLATIERIDPQPGREIVIAN
ncbi:MAG: xanthine phosphoribosyltransferase [Patescibacteria group bacterium]|nr:xanthine phosphoribosyltransferase [Patescibacteria group bacterium]